MLGMIAMKEYEFKYNAIDEYFKVKSYKTNGEDINWDTYRKYATLVEIKDLIYPKKEIKNV